MEADIRLPRGPIAIGEPAPAIEPRLSAAEPYRPDTLADGGSAFGLTVRAASVRGLFKRYAGGARQDDLCLRMHAPTRTLIVAVADGVSAAPRSDMGAALAVRQAAAAVARQLDEDVAELDWSAVFGQAAWALVEEHRRERGDPDAIVEDAAGSLATTLIVAAVNSDSVRLAAVGDSPAYVLSEDEFDLLPEPIDAGDRLLDGVTDALPLGMPTLRATTHALASDDVLLVCTDGLALPLGDGSGEVGRALARELATPPDIVDFARLLDFSRATYDDDRTLVAVWPD